MLDKIQNKLQQQYPSLSSKSSIFEYYISLENPDKQRKLINWWQQLIQSAVRKSGQLYLSPADLQIIFSLHGLKPVPLQKVMEFLSKQGKLEWIGRQTKKQEPKGWLSTINSYIWKSSTTEDVTKSSYKSMQMTHSQKIFPTKYKNELLHNAQSLILQQLQKQHQNSISYQYIYQKLRRQMPVSSQSVDLIIEELQKTGWVVLTESNNKKLLIYNSDGKLLSDQTWIELQKSKYVLRGMIQKFDEKILQRMRQQDKLLQEAKQYLQTNKNRSKSLLAQAVSLKRTTQQLQNRRKLLSQTLDNLQLNELTSKTLDIVKQSQKVIQKTSIDIQKLEQIRDKHIQISQSQRQVNDHLQQMTGGDIENEVDNMMAQIQMEIKKKKSTKGQTDKIPNKQINQEKETEKVKQHS